VRKLEKNGNHNFKMIGLIKKYTDIMIVTSEQT